MTSLPDHPVGGPHATAGDGDVLRILDDDSCFALLGTQSVGRLGFSAGGLPVVHPINYILDDGTIVFRVEPGQKLRAAEQQAVACLLIDHFDGLEHAGWTVLATGRLALASSDRPERMAQHPLGAWGLAVADSFVEMRVEILSGQSIGPAPPLTR